MGFGTVMIIYHYVGLGYLAAAYFGPRDRIKRAAVGAAILIVVAMLYFPILAQGAVIAPPRALLGLWVLPALAGFGTHMLMTHLLSRRNAPLEQATVSPDGKASRHDGGDTIEGAVARLDDALRRGDIDAVLDCYDDDAVVMLESGHVVHGKAALEPALRRLLGTRLTGRRHPHVLDACDTALYIASWPTTGSSGPTDIDARPAFTAASVFRRSRDAAGAWRWRLLIDNPFGPGSRP